MANKAKARGRAGDQQVAAITAAEVGENQQLRTEVFEIFRRWGYLQATLDPLKQYPVSYTHLTLPTKA